MVDADGGRGQEQLRPVVESSCNGFWLYQDSRGLRTAVDVCLHDCHFGAFGRGLEMVWHHTSWARNCPF